MIINGKSFLNNLATQLWFPFMAYNRCTKRKIIIYYNLYSKALVMDD